MTMLTGRRVNTRWLWIFVAILLLGFGARILIFQYGLPYVNHLDEPNFYLLANDWRGKLDAGYRNEWLKGYPPGYIWLYSGLLDGIDVIFHPNIHTDMSLYVRLMRLVSVWADMLSLSLVIVIAKWLGGRGAALITGLVWAISGAIMFLATLALPDVFSVLSCVLCAAFSVQAFRHESWSMGLLATVAGLLGIVFKYPVFPVLLLPGAFFLLLLWRHRQRVLLPSAVALFMVVGTAYGLLFVYGASGLDNAEGQKFRNDLVINILNPTRWRYTFNGLLGTTGPVLAAIAVVAVVALYRRYRLRHLWLTGLVFFTGALILAVIPGYLASDPPRTYPIRYTWPAAGLIIPCFAIVIGYALAGKPRSRWLLSAATVLSIGTLVPGSISQIVDGRKIITFALAQAWFEENVPEGSLLWMEGLEPYRSLGRYERGYPGYKNFETIYGREATDLQIDPHLVDYVYLDEQAVAQWPTNPIWPPLDQLTLLKQIGGDGLDGPVLSIYSTVSIPEPQNIAFHSLSNSELLLWGYRVQQNDSQLVIDTFWQAPDGVPPADYSYNLYLAPEDNPQNVVITHDAQLGLRRTSTWDDPDERVKGNIAPVSLDNLESGDYTVWLIVYFWETVKQHLR